MYIYIYICTCLWLSIWCEICCEIIYFEVCISVYAFFYIYKISARMFWVYSQPFSTLQAARQVAIRAEENVRLAEAAAQMAAARERDLSALDAYLDQVYGRLCFCLLFSLYSWCSIMFAVNYPLKNEIDRLPFLSLLAWLSWLDVKETSPEVELPNDTSLKLLCVRFSF